MDLCIPCPPPHRLSEKIQQHAADEGETDRHSHEQHQRRDEAALDGPVVDKVCHAELFSKEFSK